MAMLCKGMYRGKPLKGRLKVYLEFHYKHSRGRDIDSGLKITMDSLNKALYDDDNQVRELMIKIFEGKEEGVFEDKIIFKVAKLKPLGKLF
jgi:Holliday junction resolvase RusA-like endonuclease